MDNSMTYFTTGQFAKLCKVNKKTLFHYDEIELFRPAFVDENGYRYYSINQLDLFSIISILKELSVPLKEIKTYLDQRTPEVILNLSAEKLREVRREMDKLSRIKHILEETIAYTNRGLNAQKSAIRLEEQDDEIIIRSSILQEYDMRNIVDWLSIFKNFEGQTQSIGTSFVGAMIMKEDVLAGRCSSKSYLFAKTSHNQAGLSCFVKPGGLYAVAFHQGSLHSIEKTYENLVAFVEGNNLQLDGYAYEEYLIDEVAVKSEDQYVTQITVGVRRAG